MPICMSIQISTIAVVLLAISKTLLRLPIHMSAHSYTHNCACLYTRLRVPIHMSARVPIHMSARVPVHMSAHAYTHVCTCLYTCLRMPIHMSHAHVYTRVPYACLYACPIHTAMGMPHTPVYTHVDAHVDTHVYAYAHIDTYPYICL